MFEYLSRNQLLGITEDEIKEMVIDNSKINLIFLIYFIFYNF